MILMWIIPYTYPAFLIMFNRMNGVPLFILLTAVFSTVIQIFMGAPFYVNSYKSLKNKSANMDVLIALGTTAAWLYAIVLIGVGYNATDMMDSKMYSMKVMMHAHNFEISSVLITIILVGKYLESLSKKRTVDKLS
jgi:Cu+-exporting ATPase